MAMMPSTPDGHIDRFYWHITELPNGYPVWIPGGAQEVKKAVSLEDHNRRCEGRTPDDSWRYHTCPVCGQLVDGWGF